MKNQRMFLLTLAFISQVMTAGAAIQTNDLQQQALEVLRKTINTLETRDKIPSRPRPLQELSFPEAEKLYLENRMTAKEFQRYLDGHKLDPAQAAQDRAIEVLRRAEAAESRFAPVAPQPQSPHAKGGETSATTAEPNDVPLGPDQSKLIEFEKKMDELLRLKAARESAAATNITSPGSTNISGPLPPKNKRQRLDDLLKLYIQGKIPDAEYKAEREKLIAGPD